ncbi:hypothetical protein FB451DRAFT_1412623 [Mycena latifolia]|nr:hypothetical protein FB451DRAFT_1412623 [Mycena latifolia]
MPAESTSTVDNLSFVLGLVAQIATIVETAPFLGPAAALMSEVLMTYKEVKDTDEKRGVLLANITGLTRDLCSTILRMEATNHLDLIGRLKGDVEAYTGLLAKASEFIKNYDNQGGLSRILDRNDLGAKFAAFTQELDSFGARFRNNRLVDLAINQNLSARTLNKVHDIVLEEKLEKWLETPPNMKRKQLETQRLRKEGTGVWFLEGERFITWQDNPGSLWIQGPSGAGKSVLISAAISKLVADKQLFEDLQNSPSPPAVAFFYLDFKDKEGQAVESALRRITLQLSAQSPYLYRALDKQYRSSNGQTLPTYQDLLKVLKELLLGIGRTYMILDALDECKEDELEQLLDFISILRSWTPTPLHLLITSQPRSIFTEHLRDVPRILLDSSVTDKDIELFVTSELLKPNFKIWTSRADYIAERIVRKSHGMFRLAACLLVELSRRWQNPDGLEKILDNLPNDLFGIYDRFLETIHPEDFVYVEGVLRWLIFSTEEMSINELADAVAFDFSDPKQYVYKPSQREGNKVAILRWLEGLVLLRENFRGEPTAILAHASVQDYVLSARFTQKFRSNHSPSLSHTFIAQTCIHYLLYFSDHPLDVAMLGNYPLARYAARKWCHHLLLCHDQNTLFASAMRLLEDGSQQYHTLNLINRDRIRLLPESPLHLCCHNGYIEGVRGLLANGADVNREIEQGTPLYIAVNEGHTDVVHVLLENSANPNVSMRNSGSALNVAAVQGNTKIVRLLLKKGAYVDEMGGTYGSALQAASALGHTEVVQLLLEEGADVTATHRKYGTALHAAAASFRAHPEPAIVRLLLDHGADVNAASGEYGNALQAASAQGHTKIVQLLLENGADMNATGGEFGNALQAAYVRGRAQIVDLLLANGAVDTRVGADTTSG